MALPKQPELEGLNRGKRDQKESNPTVCNQLPLELCVVSELHIESKRLRKKITPN